MSELEQQMENRRAKRRALEERGVAAYPTRCDYDLEPSTVVERHGERSAEELEELGLRLTVPGRVRAIRKQGKLRFLDVSDGRAKVQAFCRKNDFAEDDWWLLDQIDLGDIVSVTGRLGRTRTGELSVFGERVRMLAKALRPLPEKWHGLTDVEARYRQRYLDLIVTPEARRVFELRAAVVRAIRRHLEDHGFVEVETPMMHSIPGGAAARPVTTHHNALDIPLYLRVAPELHLKRLTVGGMHRVYEINRNFRNEGVSTQHNPEFTMLEFYWAYSDFEQLMDFTEQMLGDVAETVLGEGARELSWRGEPLSLERPWRRLRVADAVVELGGVPRQALADEAALRAECEKRRLELPRPATWGRLLMALFDELVEDQLQQPTFVTHYPTDVSPLSKQCPDEPHLTERFELYIGGMEIANAFTELNDPEVQRQRFEEQAAAREGGDEEAHHVDYDYVRALEHGLPPTGGEGIGIDRLVMILSGSPSIRDVILFPLLRPRAIPTGLGEDVSAENDGGDDGFEGDAGDEDGSGEAEGGAPVGAGE
ncbi:MAG: lysine--tRNA ligase [Acidobacteria bacterium]|nr:MAG: lysine--tRNA ligase [Acidobacteriota bacterium]